MLPLSFDQTSKYPCNNMTCPSVLARTLPVQMENMHHTTPFLPHHTTPYHTTPYRTAPHRTFKFVHVRCMRTSTPMYF